MALDRQLSRDFWLHEFSGWADATEDQVAELQELVARVLQPTRNHFRVPVRPTSWLKWSNGELRTGAHAHGAIDFVVDDGLTREAFEWIGGAIVPSGYVGRLIYEPARAASGETKRQGEHIHLAPRAAMLAYNGDGSIQVLEEKAEGHYVFARVAATVGAAGALALGALVFLASRDRMVPT